MLRGRRTIGTTRTGSRDLRRIPLLHLIAAKGVTQAKVAGATGVTESTLSEILSGKREVSRKVMRSASPTTSTSIPPCFCDARADRRAAAGPDEDADRRR